MAHMITENEDGSVEMAFTGEKPWHGLGQEVSNKLKPKEMLKAASLDWTVEKHEIQTKSGIIIPDQYALVKSKGKKVLSTCGKKYVPIQNEEAFDFFSRFVKAGDMTMETAGGLEGGKRVWAMAKMKDDGFNIVGRKDNIQNYILLCNSHVPGQSFTIMYTPVRVVCHNTLTYALNKMKDSAGVFRMPHVREFDDEAKQQASLALNLSKEQQDSFKTSAQFLASKRAKDKDVLKFFTDLYQPSYNPELAEEDEGFQDLSPTVEKLQLLLAHQPGAEFAEGSWWQAFNAVTYYVDHLYGSVTNPDRRMKMAWFGIGATKKHEALEMAMAYADSSRKL